MNNELSALDTSEYRAWIGELKKRYRATQIKAAVAVNSAMIEFYWNLGKDISEKYPGKVRDAEFFKRLSNDLRLTIPNATGLSITNIKYARYFFELYVDESYRPQVVDDKVNGGYRPQLVDFEETRPICETSSNGILQQLVAKLFQVPWGHHRYIIDKCKGNRDKALFYVQRTIQHGWSRNVLLNWLSTDLYEREGSAQTNFAVTMPSNECDLAEQLVKDPQVFEVLGLEEEFKETDLKNALVASIEKTILAFGRGVAFMGSEYPVELGGEEKLIDLLFYVVPLHRYLIVEVKTGKFEPADLGQLLGYKVMVKHALNTPEDHEPIGLLICRDHNRILAQYMMDELKTPLGITDYELHRILPPVEKIQAALEEGGSKNA